MLHHRQLWNSLGTSAVRNRLTSSHNNKPQRFSLAVWTDGHRRSQLLGSLLFIVSVTTRRGMCHRRCPVRLAASSSTPHVDDQPPSYTTVDFDELRRRAKEQEAAAGIEAPPDAYESRKAASRGNEPSAGDGPRVPVRAWIDGVTVARGALDQLEKLSRMGNHNIFAGPICVMPDVHLGQGVTVGTVLCTRRALIPAAVGVDIGCGMLAVKTSLKQCDIPVQHLSALRLAIEVAVPHGRSHEGQSTNDAGSWRGAIPAFASEVWKRDLEPGFRVLACKRPELERTNHVNHLGTLGTGNHFIEICLDESDSVWIMLHSGSRGVGNRLGSLYIELAKKDMAALLPTLPNAEMAYVKQGTKLFDDYVEALLWAQRFAAVNRRIMMSRVLEALRTVPGVKKGFTAFEETAINCHHNYAEEVTMTVAGEIVEDVPAWAAKPGHVANADGLKVDIDRKLLHGTLLDVDDDGRDGHGDETDPLCLLSSIDSGARDDDAAIVSTLRTQAARVLNQPVSAAAADGTGGVVNVVAAADRGAERRDAPSLGDSVCGGASGRVWITRKGATSARHGQLAVIPGSMGARSYIVRGKGIGASYCSCSHGAGREYSRGEAKRRFTVEDHKKAMAGVEARLDADVIDETPMAYKPIDAVMRAQDSLVEVIHTLRQIVCVKG